MTATTRKHTASAPFHDYVASAIPGAMVCRYAGCGAVKALAPAPSVQGSRTSEAAAQAQTDAGRTTRKDRIEAAIRAAGHEGLTAERIEAVTGYGGSTVRPRIVELERERRVVKTSRTRLTASGHDAFVYVVAR